MGVSVCPMIVIGMSLDNLVTTRVETETFELHDERGQKTGQHKTESKTYYDVQTPTGIQTVNSLYSDEIANLLGVEDYPSDTKIGIFTKSYKGEGIDNYVLGRRILQIDAMYDEVNSISMIEFNQYVVEIYHSFTTDLNMVTSNLKMFLIPNVG